jgi:hypothetical protein
MFVLVCLCVPTYKVYLVTIIYNLFYNKFAIIHLILSYQLTFLVRDTSPRALTPVSCLSWLSFVLKIAFFYV